MDDSIIKIEIVTSISKARTVDITARPEKRGKSDAFTLTTYGGSMYHRGQRRRHVKSAMNRNDDGSRRRVWFTGDRSCPRM